MVRESHKRHEMCIWNNEGQVEDTKTGIRMHGILNCDKTWLTCRALHNMLLGVDGFSEKWADVSFDKLLAEGGFEISASRKDGKTQFVKVKSLAGESLRVQPNIVGEIKVSGERKFTLNEIKKGVYEIDLKEGEEIIIYAENSCDFEISPVSGETKYYNCFGPRNKMDGESKQLHDPK